MIENRFFRGGWQARPRPIVNPQDETRELPTDAAGRLNILGAVLGLACNDHQAKPRDIDADRDHVGCQKGIEWALTASATIALLGWVFELCFEPIEDLRDINGALARGQLIDPFQGADESAAETALVHSLQSCADGIVCHPPHAAQFAHRTEIAN